MNKEKRKISPEPQPEKAHSESHLSVARSPRTGAKGMKKKILLINPRIGDTQSLTPHLGLAVLAARLESAGADVLTLDYSAEHTTPPLATCLQEYDPHFVGITAVTPGAAVVEDTIRRVGEFNKRAIIAVGGPHATLYADELEKVKHLSYIVQGEAEDKIVELVETSVPQAAPQIIICESPSIKEFPIPSFRSFYNHRQFQVYPLLTSKGCPFNCSFCSVHKITSRVWRGRNIDDCFEEIKEAKEYLPRLRHIRVIDDEPAINKERFHRFLSLFAEKHPGYSLEIVNLRAKDITEETLKLMKRAGVFEVCFGVEHGSPAVFKEIDKGETLEEIARAADLVKKSRLFLRCCFIIGLPNDSFERTLESIAFAKRIKADFFHWNAYIPLRGTRAAEWYRANGKIIAEERFSLSGSSGFFIPEPSVETRDFTAEEQKIAYALAVLETNSYILTPRGLRDIIHIMIRHRIYRAALKSLARQPKYIWMQARRFHKARLLPAYAQRYMKENLPGFLNRRSP
jgi:anaerobic magnesium-protoporphyrin IX monomethyl ester cyclase